MNSASIKGNRKLTLVGAGPGDPDLITVKGAQAIIDADAILYDALVHPELLSYARRDCKLLFVGKRKGFKAYPQEEINELLVEYVYKYGHVVRLKGGDSFVFGRGAEEMNYVQSFNIPVEVIPGVTSVTSGPASQNIPVTLRNTAESFWTITATTKENELSNDIFLSAQSTATVIVLMGVSKLPQIVEQFNKFHSLDYPIAIIENATLPEERIILGTLGNIVSKANKHKAKSPAVIIIGKVIESNEIFKQIILDSNKNIS